MALPALLGGAGKALSTGSKLARTANIGTKFLGKDAKKKKPGEQGEKEVSSLMVRPSMSMVPLLKPVDMPKADVSTSDNTPTSGGDSKATLEENVAYIRKKTIQIDRLLKDSFKLRKKEAKDTQKMRAALARKGKEDRFEKGKKGVLGKAASKAGKPFSSIFDAIKNYISSILIGFIAIKLLPLLPKMLELLKIVGPVMDFILKIAGTLLDGLVTFIDWGYKAYDATLGFVKSIGGEGAAKAFEKFSGALNTMINLALILAMANVAGGLFGGGKKGGGRGGRGGTRTTTKPGQKLRPKVTTTGGKSGGPLRGIRETLRKANPFRQKPNVTGSGGGFQNPFRQKPNVTGSGGGGFQNPFRQKPNVTGSGGGGGFQNPFKNFKNPFAGSKPGMPKPSGGGLLSKLNPKSLISGVKGFGIGFAIESAGNFAIDYSFDRIFGTREERNEKFAENQKAKSPDEQQAVIDKLLKEYKKETEYQKSPLATLDRITALGGPIVSDTKLQVITDRLSALGVTPPAMQTGGQVGKKDNDAGDKQSLSQTQIVPVFKTPDLGIADIGKNIGGPKAVDKLYKQEGVQNLIRLYNEVKEVPVYGEAMASAIGMALGNNPPSVSYLSMGASLINFSNLQAAENISASTATISQTAQKFEEGGQVLVSKVSLGNSIKDTTNVANYLRNQISSIKVKPEEKTPDAIAKILEALGIKSSDYDVQEGGPSTSYPPTISSPSSSGGASGAVSGSPEMKALLDVLAFAEGTVTNRNGATGPAGYSTWAGYQMHGPSDLTGLSIQEVHDLQTSFMQQGKTRMTGSAVVGRYQFKDLLKYYAPLAGLSGSDKFSAENQDKMAIAEIKARAGITTQMLKDQGLTQRSMDRLAPIWASMPYSPKGGASYYGGQPSKSASSLKSEYSTRLGVAQEREKAQVAKSQPKPQGGGLLGNLFGGGSQQQSQEQGQGGSKVPKGSVNQWLHGNPSRKGYDAGHAGMSNAHDHFSFNSRSAAVSAFKALKNKNYKPYEFEDFTSVGKHSPSGGHFGPVGQPPTYNDKTDGVAFDIPWSSYGSGPIGKRDYDKSFKAAQIVGAAQGGGPVPGAFKGLQETMGYDKSKTKVLIQPMIVEKEVPMPMPVGGGGGGMMVIGGEVNNTTDSLAAG